MYTCEPKPKPIMEVRNTTGVSVTTLCSKKFLIATGAVPIVPERLEMAAKRAGLTTYTYRTLLQPSSGEDEEESIWQLLESQKTTRKGAVVIAGGGATACELGHSLARLGKGQLKIHLIAPNLLPGEDLSL
jgi:pyruvate/2-oxoglutarate dehydrogenase complex dihydrolipoamide dehydrogenase (E3) component